MRHKTVTTLTQVANTYRNAIRDGKSPVDAVAKELGISYEAAKQRIRRARRAGYDLRVFDKPPERGDTLPW